MRVLEKSRRPLRYAIYVASCFALLITPFAGKSQCIFYPASAADSGGWNLDSSPTVYKSPVTNDACYFGKMLTIIAGSAIGVLSWKDCSGGSKCGGAYTGTVTWTTPPSYLKPGSKVTFSGTAKTSAQNSCGELNIGSGVAIKIGGGILIDVIDTRAPSLTADYLVPSGSPGDKLAIEILVKGANQTGSVTYNYTYKGVAATPPGTNNPGTVSPAPRTNDPGTATITPGSDDSGAVISAVSGNVDMRPDVDKRWRAVSKGATLPYLTHIKTYPNSSVTISLPNGDTFVLQPNTEIMINYPDDKKSRDRLLMGNIKANIVKKDQDESLEIDMDQADCSISGTIFVLEATPEKSTLKVIEGAVSITSKVDGKTAMAAGGEAISADNNGLGQKLAFDVAAELARWAGTAAAGADASGGTSPTGPSGNNAQTSKNPVITLPKCPITTALEVDPISPRLTIFRSFRDRVLACSDMGKAIVEAYYGTGTWVVDNVLSNNTARFITRYVIVEPLALVLAGSAFFWNG